MRRNRLLVLAFTAATVWSADYAAAQGWPSPAEATARLRIVTFRPASTLTPAPVHLGALPDSLLREKKDHTVTGLLIGAGLGFLAGWGFYNAMCEAVDNRCSGSRLPDVVFGSAIGASLGALIGSGWE